MLKTDSIGTTRHMALAFCWLLLGMAGLLTIVSSQPASAVDPPIAVLLMVTKTQDTNDGSCDVDDCSLREAISESNSDGAHDVIRFAPGLSGTIVLDGSLGGLIINDEPAVSNDLSIEGPGAGVLSVSGNHAVRPFLLPNGATATIGKLSVVDGSGDFGGGIRNQPGGTLTLEDSTVSGNAAVSDGGGVFNLGTFTLNRSTVSGNEGNVSNWAGSGAGGIFNGGTLTLGDSTISGNEEGGIWQSSDFGTSSPSATIANSTISGNTTSGSGAGGISNFSGSMSIAYSTITKNSGSTVDGSGVGSAGNNPPTATQIRSSIISANTNNDDVHPMGGTTNTFFSGGHNLIGGGLTLAFNQSGDRFGVTNPRLGALASNGGPTKTHALLKRSPAIDKGTNTDCPPTDQRGKARPKNGDGKGKAVCDIGSFEKAKAHHR